MLRPDRREHLSGGLITEQPQDAQRLRRHGFHRPQQRRLLIECLTRPRDERRRDDQRRPVRRFENKCGAGRVPRRVATGLERGPNAAGRKRTGVRLAPDQFLAAEFEDRLAVAGRGQEAVMLLRRQAGHRVEEVGVVRGSLLDGPILHGGGDRVGDLPGPAALSLIVFLERLLNTALGSRYRWTASPKTSAPKPDP